MKINKRNVIGIDRLKICCSLNQNMLMIYSDKMNGIRYEKSHKDTGVSVLLREDGVSKEVNVNVIEGSITKGFGNDDYIAKINLKRVTSSWDLEISLNAPKLYFRNNEQNISENNIDIKNITQVIKDMLEENGLELEGELNEILRVTKVEFNTNVYNKDFKKAFKIVNDAWLTAGMKVFKVETDKNGLEYLCIESKKAWKIKMYDKYTHLTEIGEEPTEDEISRIEVEFKSDEINRLLESNNNFGNFLENIDIFERRYVTMMSDYIEKPTNKLVKKIEKVIIDDLKEGKSVTNVLKKWAGRSETSTSIVDLQIFDNAVRKYYKSIKKGNVARDIRNSRNSYKKQDEEKYYWLTDNLCHIEQFMESIR